MVDKLIALLAQSIEKEFGNEYAVYTEAVTQNAKKPCFFALCESVERMQMLNGRFFVRAHVLVSFEAEGDEKRLEGDKIIAKLFKLLGRIEGDSLFFNGRKVHGKWSDGVLSVRGIYDLWPEEAEEDVDLMEKIELKGLCYGNQIYQAGN